ncbi:leucine rich repeat (LRR) protein [Aquimarina sp. MAR_2010_214]|uniref:leucine-rich repeat domain-containing protein n=1 Tax=Aquimarina sp. MAR_2010_214 TaxID=1250026 RepID=UPI000C70FE24|nr:leucine-rich repeat domain-containing protein [Aquimarina sp. MAR_2010_214]PKV50926.1 leucine rich repeat (LRR) protein [Aquimarina sp. MAR_2010_214]
MNIKELYNELSDAYSDNNLNTITGKLIALYKSKNFGKIREIANKISKYVTIDEEKDAKCFSKLIVLYHPDKGELHRKSINKLYNENNLDSLTKYSHILQLNEIENTVINTIDESVDYHPEYAWESNEKEGYYFYEKDEVNTENESDSKTYDKSFYNEIKFRQYGDLSIDFPPHYLEDIEEFELAQSGIELLDGIEYCQHAVIFDLSNNSITDISELSTLNRLEELYLGNNQIGYIDALSNLFELKIIDLSNNQIDDISPLFELENLEYVNIIGNKIPDNQIKKLKEKEIIVMN